MASIDDARVDVPWVSSVGVVLSSRANRLEGMAVESWGDGKVAVRGCRHAD